MYIIIDSSKVVQSYHSRYHITLNPALSNSVDDRWTSKQAKKFIVTLCIGAINTFMIIIENFTTSEKRATVRIRDWPAAGRLACERPACRPAQAADVIFTGRTFLSWPQDGRMPWFLGATQGRIQVGLTFQTENNCGIPL